MFAFGTLVREGAAQGRVPMRQGRRCRNRVMLGLGDIAAQGIAKRLAGQVGTGRSDRESTILDGIRRCVFPRHTDGWWLLGFAGLNG